MATYSQENLQDLLTVYYNRLFPYGPYFRWLTYGNVKSQYFENREFSFTLADDVYIRFQSFKTPALMEIEVKKIRPFKIDIGAVYTLSPKDCRMRAQFQPIEKELVFDIDMTDYDEIRSCCSGADVCPKCWKYMAIACKILDAALRDDFGWKHVLWVFSGRRGIHCWVCDESARSLDTSSRSAVAEYLQILSGGQNQKKVQLSGDSLHPSITRAVKIINAYFETLVEEQNTLATPESFAKFLPVINDEALRKDVEAIVQKRTSAADRWQAFLDVVQSHVSQGLWKKKCKHITEEVVLQYAYPRLDINVTLGLNHLLKSPFCVHPKTGKVCVPFVARNVDKFDPTTVPTISTLIDEITQYDKKNAEVFKDDVKSNSNVKDYKKTSLNKSVSIFEEFLRPMENSWKALRQQNSDNSMEF